MTATLRAVSAVAPVRSRARLTALVAVGSHLLIGLLVIGRASLWGDEAFTAESVRLPLGRLLPMLTRIDVNMSAYYLVVKAWVSVFGTSEIALRLPSLIMSTATVGLAAWLMSRWFGPRSAATTAIALGLNPYFVSIGVTARPFAMLALLFTASLGLFVTALGDRRPGIWVALVLVDILAFYSSLLAGLSIATQVLYLLVIDRRLRVGQLPAVIVGCLGVVPAVLFVAPSDTLNWLGQPSVRSLVATGWDATGRIAGIAFVILGLIGLVLRAQPVGKPLADSPRSRYLLPTFVVVPVVLMLALLPVQSLFTPPYLVTVFVASALLVGVTVANLVVPRAAVAAMALTLGCVAGIVFNLIPSPTLAEQDWKAVDALLDTDVKPGDAVVFPNTYYRVAGEYYARSGRLAQVAAARLPDVPWFSQPPDTYDRLKRTGVYLNRNLIPAGLSGINTVWLVGPDDDWMDRAIGALHGAGWSTRSEIAEPGLVIRLMKR